MQPIETITRRHLYELCALIAPGSIISHRSAFEQQRPTSAGNYYLTGTYRRDVQLPGVKPRTMTSWRRAGRKYREDDSHDILGTYHAILKSKQSPQT